MGNQGTTVVLFRYCPRRSQWFTEPSCLCAIGTHCVRHRFSLCIREGIEEVHYQSGSVSRSRSGRTRSNKSRSVCVDTSSQGLEANQGELTMTNITGSN